MDYESGELKDIELISKYCCMNEDEIFNEFFSTLHSLSQYYHLHKHTNKYFLAENSDCPVLVVAHVDTFFGAAITSKSISWAEYNENISSDKFMYCTNNNPAINCGFDDRAGVAMIHKLIDNGIYPSILLTCGEEDGCLGAISFIKEYAKAPSFIKFIIELDRRGQKDCVFYQCQNQRFKKLIMSYDFEEANGSYSDISIIAPIWQIAAVNLSIGYFNEHTNNEFLFLSFWEQTFNKVYHIIKDAMQVSELKTFTYLDEHDLLSALLTSGGFYKREMEDEDEDNDSELDISLGYIEPI